jgi:hypothetical protein
MTNSDSNTNDEDLTLDELDDSVEVTESVQSAISSDYKVLGEKDAPGGAGVVGHNTASSGNSYGVEGVSQADGSLSGASPAGVKGATTGSGQTYGVLGIANSPTARAAGVKAEARAGNANAMIAKGGSYGHGLESTTEDDQSKAVWARHVGSNGTGNDHAVLAQTYTEAAGVAGVRGEAKGTAGNETYGVYGTSSSSSGYGLYTPDDAKVDGDLAVEGDLPQSTGGAEITLGSDQTISSNTYTKIQYDSKVTDQRNEFDTNTNEFTCAYDGNYHVEASAAWQYLPSGAYTIIEIEVNGADVGAEHNQAGASGFQSDAISKTLFGLSAGDSIHVEIYQDQSDQTLVSGTTSRRYTTLTIGQVG